MNAQESTNVTPECALPVHPTQVSKIPPSYAAEVLRRREECGWTLRQIADSLSAELGESISHRAVDRLLHRQSRLAALKAQRPLQEELLQDMEKLRESLATQRRLIDDTEEELARARKQSPELVPELESDQTRNFRIIRSLVVQFNAFGKHVPKPEARVVPACTPSADRFTRPAPAAREQPNHRAPAPAAASTPKTDSPAVPVCTPDSERSTPTKALAAEAKAVPAVTPAAASAPESAETLQAKQSLPAATVLGAGMPMTFGAWIIKQREASGRLGIEIDPSWTQNRTDVIFVDLSEGQRPLLQAFRMLERNGNYEPRMVFVLPETDCSELLELLPSELHAPLRLPLTKEKVNAALKSVAAAKPLSEASLDRAA